MNPDLSKNSPEAQEVGITALLLGELPAERAADLRQAIERDPELARLHERLKLTIDLVRQAAANGARQPESQPAPLRLSEDRRERLLEQFKTVTPKEFAKPRRRRLRQEILLSAAAVLVALLGLAVFQWMSGRSGPAAQAPKESFRRLARQNKVLGGPRPAAAVQEQLKRLADFGPPPGATSALAAASRSPESQGTLRRYGKKQVPGMETEKPATSGSVFLSGEPPREREALQADLATVSDSNAADTRRAVYKLSAGIAGANPTPASNREALKEPGIEVVLPATPPTGTPVPAASAPVALPVSSTSADRYIVLRRPPAGPEAAPAAKPDEAVLAPLPAAPAQLAGSTARITLNGISFFDGRTNARHILVNGPALAGSFTNASVAFDSGMLTNRPVMLAFDSEPTQWGFSTASSAIPEARQPITAALTSSNLRSSSNNRATSDLEMKDLEERAKPLRSIDRRRYLTEQAPPSSQALETGQAVGAEKLPALAKVQETDAPAQRVSPPAAPVPQPEIQARENAFSTFSLNVSDVSFKLAAASLEKGVMPEASGIRSEEFINAFDYRDPEPAPGAPIAFAWDRARYPFAQNRDLLRLSLKTAAQGRQPGRALNLVLLLDNSGSMERADRVRIIHEALRVLASQLGPQDVLSIVTFARTARLWVDGLPGNQAGRAVEEVSRLTPQGGTNLEEALNLAYQAALRHYLAGGVNRVVLLTDGAANLGNVAPEILKQKVEAQRRQGIALDCFGIGWEGYNDDLLEVLTRSGGGRYGFVNTPEAAATEFAAQLAGALRVAASDVKVQVEFNASRVVAYRQIGYAKHQLAKEQFRDNSVKAAQLGAAEAGNALYVIQVDPRGSGPLGTVRVRYHVPGTADIREQEWTLPYTGAAVALDQAGPAIRLAGTAAAFSEWLAGSPFAGEVNPDALLSCLNRVPEVYGADARPRKLEWMIRQARSITGK